MADERLTELVQRFADSECSWLSTVRPSGKVHAAPVWHVWFAGCVYLVTMETAVKVRAIESNPSVSITYPDPLNVIIIEGEAQVMDGMVEALRPLFQAKYNWDIATDEQYQTVIQITPHKLMAWGDEGASHRTRWTQEEITAVHID